MPHVPAVDPLPGGKLHRVDGQVAGPSGGPGSLPAPALQEGEDAGLGGHCLAVPEGIVCVGGGVDEGVGHGVGGALRVSHLGNIYRTLHDYSFKPLKQLKNIL